MVLRCPRGCTRTRSRSSCRHSLQVPQSKFGKGLETVRCTRHAQCCDFNPIRDLLLHRCSELAKTSQRMDALVWPHATLTTSGRLGLMALAAPDPMKEPQGTSEESGVCLTPWDAFSQDLRQTSVQTARSRQPWQAWNCGDTRRPPRWYIQGCALKIKEGSTA